MYWSHVLTPLGLSRPGIRTEHDFRPLERPAAAAVRFAVSQWRRVGMATPDRSVRLGLSGACVRALRDRVAQPTTNTGSIPAWDMIPSTVIPLLAFALAGLILAKNFATATPGDRQRFAFVALGTLISFVAYAIYYVPGVPFAVGQGIGFAVVLMPICIAYAVFRLRVLDVNFVLNRALVFGVLSVGVIALVSILDWFFSRVVAIGRLAVGFELLATIAVGFLLDRINRSVEGIVEALFFRERRLAERHLRRAAAALPYATDEEAIVDGLVQIPVDAMELAAAALYRRSEDGARFKGVATATPNNDGAAGVRRERSLGAHAARGGEDHMARQFALATRSAKRGDLYAGRPGNGTSRAHQLHALRRSHQRRAARSRRGRAPRRARP